MGNEIAKIAVIEYQDNIYFNYNFEQRKAQVIKKKKRWHRGLTNDECDPEKDNRDQPQGDESEFHGFRLEGSCQQQQPVPK